MADPAIQATWMKDFEDSQRIGKYVVKNNQKLMSRLQLQLKYVTNIFQNVS